MFRWRMELANFKGRIEMNKICFCMTVPSALRSFMADHVRALAERYDVTVFCNFSKDDCEGLFDSSVKLVHVPFAREIKPVQDLKCLCLMISHLRKGRFSSVHSVMPKTGLLAMAAGWIARVPVRIHLFTGQVWVTHVGFWRRIFKGVDRLIDWLATDLYADSPSQRDFLLKENVIRSGKTLCDGSVNGVNTDRFKPDPEIRKSVRNQFGILEEQVVFGFVGRLHLDKGILDLVEAFSGSGKMENACLLFVGSDEGNVEQLVRERFSDLGGQILFAGFTSEPERFYPAFDVFCIPSYREGFGSSVIEAAACEVPALASRIYGLTDAVEENVTGLMHEPHDVDGIRNGLERFVHDSELREQFGRAARKRVLEKFSRDHLVQAMMVEYERLLGSGCIGGEF